MNYYEQIKGLLISNEIYKKIKDYSKNKSDLETYYNVGKLIVEAQGGETRAKYGCGLIKDYSNKLIVELKDKKYSYRNLMNMRKYYLIFKDKKVNAMRSQLSWSHYRELLTIKNIDEIKYYIYLAVNKNLSYRALIQKIRSKEYEKLSDITKDKLMKSDKLEIVDLIPNPLKIKNNKTTEIVTEKILQQLILEDIRNFLKELGEGFTFVDTEYKIKLGDRYNYIDLLLYNIKFKCYVVVELKITELKKAHTGQIMTYMNYIDENIKTIAENKTVGIIICKQDNAYIIKYCSDEKIIAREYELV